MKYFGISLGSRTNLRDSSKPRPFVDLVGHVERDVLKGVQFLYVTDVDTKVPAIIDDPLKSGSLSAPFAIEVTEDEEVAFAPFCSFCNRVLLAYNLRLPGKNLEIFTARG